MLHSFKQSQMHEEHKGILTWKTMEVTDLAIPFSLSV